MFKRVLKIIGGENLEQIKVKLPVPEEQIGFTAVIAWEMIRKDKSDSAKLNNIKYMLSRGLTNKGV